MGVLMLHGVYDLVANHGFITPGTSHDTSAFACDSLCLAWPVVFWHWYPHAVELLILCDGGSNF
jgi:hypothetical protein